MNGKGKPALRVTFYSYKGGVGRTRAMLNVASILANAGRRVVAVDLDLEAPGFEHTGLMDLSPKAPGKGVSDFCFDHRAPDTDIPVEEYLRRAEARERAQKGGELWLMSAGSRPGELVERIPDFYRDPSSGSAQLFQLLVVKLEAEMAPDYIFFDSRTGLADIAGISTVELAEVLVAVAGLNEQNIAGMENVLRVTRKHPARTEVVPTLLVLSPVPRDKDLPYRPLADLLPVLPGDSQTSPYEPKSDLLAHRVFDAQRRLLLPILADTKRFTPRFSRLRPPEDFLHSLEYDPRVPLDSELARVSPKLYQQYQRLAHSITRANKLDEVYMPPPQAPGDSLTVPILVRP